MHAQQLPKKDSTATLKYSRHAAAHEVPLALKNFDSLPDSAEVRLPVVKAQYGCSDATVWRRVKQGKIPKPIRRGGITSWRVGDIRKNKAAA